MPTYEIKARTVTVTTGELKVDLPAALGDSPDEDVFDALVYDRAKSGALVPEDGIFPTVLTTDVKVMEVWRGTKRIFPRERKLTSVPPAAAPDATRTEDTDDPE